MGAAAALAQSPYRGDGGALDRVGGHQDGRNSCRPHPTGDTWWCVAPELAWSPCEGRWAVWRELGLPQETGMETFCGALQGSGNLRVWLSGLTAARPTLLLGSLCHLQLPEPLFPVPGG